MRINCPLFSLPLLPAFQSRLLEHTGANRRRKRAFSVVYLMVIHEAELRRR
jgi:hypothetical protein